MAEPLKAVYDPPFARNLARLLQAACPPFDAEGFERRIMDEMWGELERKNGGGSA